MWSGVPISLVTYARQISSIHAICFPEIVRAGTGREVLPVRAIGVSAWHRSCTSFTIISTAYVSTNHNITSCWVFETCSCLFASSGILKGRLLKRMSDHPLSRAAMQDIMTTTTYPDGRTTTKYAGCRGAWERALKPRELAKLLVLNDFISFV